jgi:hypothetical protein
MRFVEADEAGVKPRISFTCDVEPVRAVYSFATAGVLQHVSDKQSPLRIEGDPASNCETRKARNGCGKQR